MTDLATLRAQRAALNQAAVQAEANRLPVVCCQCGATTVSPHHMSHAPTRCLDCGARGSFEPVTQRIADLDRLIAWVEATG
jgi:hypothetical protein